MPFVTCPRCARVFHARMAGSVRPLEMVCFRCWRLVEGVAPGLLPRTTWLQASRRPPCSLPCYPLAVLARPYCRPLRGWLRAVLMGLPCRACRQLGGHKMGCGQRRVASISPTSLFRCGPVTFGPWRTP